ncbi:MAG: hypothetical protein A2X86_04665 [Bdellovibrionales bacterium GWA2_49_15]|nr:MAG: hypothetical protein A2X86_04665 [Bdellovibrionales bacterium GWA2_49_15]
MKPTLYCHCLVLFSILLVACSGPRPAGTTEAEILFKEAQKYIDKKQFILANEKLNTLRSQHPYSYYATPAELIQADILFKQENFVESASAYILFRDFHPKHEKIAYVVWMIAESFYNQLPSTSDRDLSQGYEAIKYYQEVLAKYPKSEYVAQAKEKGTQISEMFKQKEQYIADFYFKTEVFDAARYRYLAMIDEFKEPNIVDHSIVRILQSSLELGEKPECIQYAKILRKKLSSSSVESFEKVLDQCKTN